MKIISDEDLKLMIDTIWFGQWVKTDSGERCPLCDSDSFEGHSKGCRFVAIWERLARARATVHNENRVMLKLPAPYPSPSK